MMLITILKSLNTLRILLQMVAIQAPTTLFSNKKSNIAPERPVGDIEGSRRLMNLTESPLPQRIDGGIDTPSMTAGENSINEEFMEHYNEQDKIDEINDHLKVGSIHVLNTKDK
mmetsp:Transcript_31972/g.31363  ORF Transcript_31972/g.31363 Transcript_31972/m.31363 type:complete len:114 (+) Transcript_31972:179-520(+)